MNLPLMGPALSAGKEIWPLPLDGDELCRLCELRADGAHGMCVPCRYLVEGARTNG